ncbi:MAG: carboxypeptidase-like regulatory domain-containing protein [Gammaproteobacteria bacterium]|nr:carboxypeptidase-like regulatory domain-containing protein [Gammaproteobacteria bacterium]
MKHFCEVLMLLAAAALCTPTLAEHEVDHRYTVRGYVLDDQRQPVAGQQVSIRGHTSATTDSSGAYSIRLHLHNADLGKTLQIHSSGTEHAIRVNFDRADTRTPRVHYANFIGGEFVPGELSGVGFPLWGYAAAGLGALTAGGLLFAAKRRGARRPTSVPPAAHPTKRRKARGKRTKRKR